MDCKKDVKGQAVVFIADLTHVSTKSLFNNNSWISNRRPLGQLVLGDIDTTFKKHHDATNIACM